MKQPKYWRKLRRINTQKNTKDIKKCLHDMILAFFKGDLGMINIAKLVGLALLSASSLTYAANYSAYAGTYSSSTLGGANISLNSTQYSSNGSDAVAPSVPGSEIVSGGFKGDAKATANGNTLSTHNLVTISPAPTNGPQLAYASANSASSIMDSVAFGSPTKIRFYIDYSLDALGKNTNTGISFSAISNGETLASFYDSITMWSGGSLSRTGSWVSDWLNTNGSVDYQLAANSSTTTLYTQPSLTIGTVASNSNVSFRYEIDTPISNTPPVPEPETYAMLLAGLGVIGVAARRRTERN